MSTELVTEQVLRGAISTPAGDRIPMKVCMRPVSGFPAYSHVGEIDIPSDWLAEFEATLRGFVFRSEHGECFTQFQILEETTGPDGAPQRLGRIILMRDVSDSDALPVPAAQTTKASHLQLVGA